MFVHPTQVLDLIGRVTGVAQGRLVIDRHGDRDDMIVEAETSGDVTDTTALTEALSRFLTDDTKLRTTVGPGSIGQSGEIIDTRGH